MQKWGKKAIGKNAERFNDFPVLIKLIDAKKPLSIQVHPDDKYAKEHENKFGKTEMWYVIDCDEGTSLIYGFKEEITKEQFEKGIKDNSFTELCQTVPVKKGDVFFIPSGTLHAIGAGILIAEVQQNSDVTYRVYDYGRLGTDGKPRQLHISQALDVTTLTPVDEKYKKQYSPKKTDFGSERELASCNMFKVKLIDLNGKVKLKGDNSFISLLVVEGSFSLKYGLKTVYAKNGDSIFIPCKKAVTIKGNAQIIKTMV